MEYVFKNGYPKRGMDAQSIGYELEALEAKCGVLSPELVVEAAKKKRSAMHNAFEWDDTKAARMGRRRQAAELLGGIVVIIEGSEEPVRRFIKVITEPVDPADKISGYVTLQTAMSDTDQRKAILKRAKGELQAFKRKYKTLQELAAIIEVIDGL